MWRFIKRLFGWREPVLPAPQKIALTQRDTQCVQSKAFKS